MALDITVDNNTIIAGISNFKTGESTAASKGFGIFPGRFRDYINAANPNWVDPNYTPVAPAGDPDARGGIGTNGVTMSLARFMWAMAISRTLLARFASSFSALQVWTAT